MKTVRWGVVMGGFRERCVAHWCGSAGGRGEPPPTPDKPASALVMHRPMNLKKHLRTGNNDDKKPQIGLVWPWWARMIYSFICDINSISWRSPDHRAAALLQPRANDWTQAAPPLQPPPESKLSSQSGARNRRTATLTLFVPLIVFPSSLSGHVAVGAANDRGTDFKSACTQSACEDVVLPERNVLVTIFPLLSGLQ